MDFKIEYERLESRVRSLEKLVRQQRSILSGISDLNPHQNVLVKATEKIEPGEKGICDAMSRRKGLTGNEYKLEARKAHQLKVYNHRKTPIWCDEEFHVAVNVWGDYFRVRDAEHYFAWFKTPTGGIDGHNEGDPTKPGRYDFCERYYWDADTKQLKVLEDPETSDPVVEPVHNFTPSDVGPEKFIMAKRFGPDWFIDVEPC